ncbi:MAG: quinolinate synthase [Bacteroidetes bacterium GWF2_33_16]|nr:MAG: quinolinate synthase [Bacteroidetes bacterium GWE2_32_14]OFY03429.1 MAG: quinolinate synthase [Bacteroidetes bacterium GWF2_33_16]
MVVENTNITDGFVNSEIDKNIDIIAEINKLKKEKNAIILAHYYQTADVQDIADFVGDSLALSQKAAETDAKIILFAGVHFMAETAKILAPQSKVLIPDLNAGCSLANSCPPDEFEKFVNQHPDHLVISYVNTTAAIKTFTDICCTSTNALQIVDSLPKDQKIIFAPDRNLGNYINRVTGRDMIIWDGACHVHEEFSVEGILALKKQYPNAQVISHPECQKPVQLISDFIGSTAALLKFTQVDKGNEYIVATESGILHQMKKASPQKLFIVAPAKDSTCGCNDCNFMKLITIKKIYNTLKFEKPEVILDDETIRKAKKSIDKMLEISKKLKL